MNTTELFNQAVKDIGGRCLDEELKSDPKHENADYIFDDYKVVAEFKCLQKDYNFEQTIMKRIDDLYPKWVKQGLIPSPSNEKTVIETNNLPIPCTQELFHPIQQKLQRVVKKANKQIKIIKTTHNLASAKGLLIIANDFNHSLQINDMCYFIYHIFNGGGYSQINELVFLTGNVKVRHPTLNGESMFYANILLPDRERINKALTSNLSNSWINVLKAHEKIIADVKVTNDPKPTFIDDFKVL